MSTQFKNCRNTFWLFLTIFLFIFVFLSVKSAQAVLGIDENIKQVKYPNSPTVYYLNHSQKIKKAYVNEDAFLSYGNNWEDVKTISPDYLDLWKEAKLVRVENDPAVYEISNGKKRAIKSAAEFLRLGYKWGEIMMISDYDLSLYSETDEVDDDLEISASALRSGKLNIIEEPLLNYHREIITGSTGQVFGRFRISELSGSEDVLIKEIVFVNDGTSLNSNFSNLKLRISNRLVAFNPTVIGKEIIFRPSNLRISQNSSKTIVVLGDILDGADRVVDLHLQKMTAVGVKKGLFVDYGSASTNEKNKVNDASLLVSPASTKPSLATLNKIKGEIISSFNLKSSVKTLEFSEIGFSLETGDDTPELSNLYIVNHKTGEILSEIEINSYNYYTVEIDKILNSSDKSLNISFVAKIPEAQVGDYYRIILNDLSYIVDEQYGVIMTTETVGEKYEVRNNKSSIVKVERNLIKITDDGNVDLNSNPNPNPVFERPDEENFVLRWPVNGHVNYAFHDSRYIYDFEHQGIDIAASQGTSVRAAQSGVVVAAVNGGLTGYSYVTIDHGNGFKTVYGHLLKINVIVGQRVTTSTVVGLSGGKPGTPGAGQYSNGPHLHFELIANGNYINPEIYLP